MRLVQKFLALHVVGVGLAAATAGCSSDEGSPPGGTGGVTATGGTTAIGGAGGTAAAGAPAGGTPSSSGGAGGGAGTTGPGGDVPQDLSRAGIEAFLKSGVFASWTWDEAQPRGPRSVSPHGRVRVAINDTLKNGIAAGKDGSSEDKAFPAGSMALKEMYDDADASIGRAFILKHGAGSGTSNWLYYCDADPTRCGTSGVATPFYDNGTTLSGCNICHGTYFFIGAN